jgi:hypothetical protein
MMTAVKIIVDAVLDQETLHEIKMLRGIRLAHYEKMAADPDEALKTLQKAGLKEASTPAQIAASAYAKIDEIKSRLAAPDIVYEDELALYVNSLSEDSANQ